MDYQKKFKQLSISMLIGLALIIVVIISGRNALTAFLFGETTMGTVVEYSISINRDMPLNKQSRVPTRHEVLVEYQVDNTDYWILVNSHGYSATGLIKKGTKLTVSYKSEYPQDGFVMNYALFTTISSILVPFILLIFIFVTPQWLYARKKSLQSR